MKRIPKACGYRLVVKLKKVEERTASGIIIASARVEREQEAMQEATVVDVGPEAFKQFGDTQWCKKGDLVLIQKYSGAIIPDIEEDEVYRVINDQDVWIRFEEKL